jgi:hypothetical protein
MRALLDSRVEAALEALVATAAAPGVAAKTTDKMAVQAHLETRERPPRTGMTAQRVCSS